MGLLMGQVEGVVLMALCVLDATASALLTEAPGRPF